MIKLFMTLVFVFVVFVGCADVYAQSPGWQCPTNCSCPNNTFSVACYGAIPNDGLGDWAAIQNAINYVPLGWKVYIPAGRYLLEQSLEINRNDITLYGDGIASELYTIQNSNFMLLSIPNRLASTQCPTFPKNILIERLTFSGDLNRGTVDCPGDSLTGCSLLSGIYIWTGEDITLRDILVKDFAVEGIAIASGHLTPKNITLLRVRTQRIRRNSLHLGYGENIVIKDSLIENSQDSVWAPYPLSGNAIDLEVEGLDKICATGVQRDPYLYNTSITNTLVKSSTADVSKGGIAIQPAFGPIRKLSVLNNVLINSAGITSTGADGPSPRCVGVLPEYLENCIDLKVGPSLRNRELDISSNWVSNLHPNHAPWDVSTAALSVFASGDVPDINGANDVKLNNNVLTVYIAGGNNRLFQFAGVKNLSGNNNVTYRPYQDVDDPVNSGHNFLWPKERGANSDLQLGSTLDNGWIGSRLVCYPPYSYSCALGTGNSLTWLVNPYATSSASPTVISVFVTPPLTLEVSVSEPNNLPVRVMVLHNGLPLGLRDVVNNTVSIPLIRLPSVGDVFVVQAINQNGQSSEQTCTYHGPYAGGCWP